MAADGKQKLKIIYLMQMLMKETDSTKGLTMAQILSKLEEQGIPAERKSIYRDIDVLRTAGFDIECAQRAPVEYYYKRDSLTLDQIAMLVDIVQSCKFLTDRMSNQLVNAIRDLASERERKQLSKRVHVEGRIKSKSESVFHNVNVLHLAQQNKHKVSFLYYKYDINKKRVARHDGQRYVVSPLRIVFSDGFYYLVGWNDQAQELRTYRIDRMELPQELPEPAVHNKEISAATYNPFEYQVFGMYDDNQRVVAQLQVAADGVDIIIDRFGLDVDLQPKGKDKAIANVKVAVSPQFFGWVAGMNGVVTIVGPKRLVTQYKEWLTSLMPE